VTVEELTEDSFRGIDIALFSAGGSISKEYAPKFAAAGAVVIDNSSAFRYESDIPLVVTEVNPDQISNRPRGIIANPNCSTMQLLVALAPIHRAVGIERINIATYQSVSGTGQKAIEELGRQHAALADSREARAEVYPVQIAFNVIPHGGDFLDNGYTTEEMKLVWETRKILGDDSIQVNATVVRVPVFYGHSEAVAIETREKITAAQARALLEKAPGVEVVDERRGGGYPTPVTHAAGRDATYVGRIREDISHPRGLNLWIVSDNIRKGAALNAVQIAELLAKAYS
jgi:aspartate-semialdehyde dehydrogenase